MALSRRTGSRFQGSIWPGFVDAMTGLLLVLMFVLTIFMVLQAVQTQRINGQESELNSLSGEVAALAQALGIERQNNAGLEARLGTLNSTLDAARDQASQQAALIASLTATRDAQAAALDDAQSQITSFEAQVATLLSQRDEVTNKAALLEQKNTELVDEKVALNLALSQARRETDAQAETARLAAARRDALAAMIEELNAKNADTQKQLAAVKEASEVALSEAEAARLTEAAAAERLRDKLKNADAELTAMTLALEAQRKDAEDTLTLLAAARTAEGDLNAKLAAALLDVDQLQTEVSATEQALADREGQALAERDEFAAEREELAADSEKLRAKLAEALAAKLAAETIAADQTTETEKQQALLAAARKSLAAEEDTSAAAQRQTELLNQQVAALRGQLGDLRTLLDDAVARDAAKEVQLQSLGSDLNTALARVATEERRRAELEAAERKRLEAKAKDLEQYRSEFFGRLRELLGKQAGVRIEGDRFVFCKLTKPRQWLVVGVTIHPDHPVNFGRNIRRDVAQYRSNLGNLTASIR